MKKTLLTLVLVFVLALTLAACDSGEKQTEAPTTATTDAPTEAPTEKPTETPTSTPTEKPTEEPTEAPIDDACAHSYENKICTMCGGQQPSEGLEFTSNDDGTCYVSGIGSCTDTDIVIPSISPNGDIVTSIGESAFRSCKNITNVAISDSVASIGKSAFSGCRGLTSMVINDSVTSIGESAFYDCRELTSVTIGSGVTELGSSVFLYCMKLVEVINKSSLNITADASSDGYIVSSALEVHSGESKIVNKDGYLFYTYNGVNYLVNYVGTATELTLPESYNGENYEVHQYAFHENTKITSVVISDSVTSIGYAALASCDNLTNIVIGNSVTSIAEKAFSNCEYLASVIIPESVATIGSSTFYSCAHPTIYCEATEQPSGWDDKWLKKCYAIVVWGYTGEE